MNFPFLDLRKINQQLESEFQSALSQVINNDWLILGESVSTFESSFAKYTSSRHCVSVANGLDALYLILKALEIGPGDEVIVPAHTFVATWLSVSKIGATIVPAEPANGTHNVALSTIRSLVTSKTKAIIIVHLYGHPVCCEDVVDFCRSPQSAWNY